MIIIFFVSLISAYASEQIGSIELDRSWWYELPPGTVIGKINGSIPLELHICSDSWVLTGQGKITSTVAVGGVCVCEGGGQARVSLKGFLEKPCEIRIRWTETGGDTISCRCEGGGGVDDADVPFPHHPHFLLSFVCLDFIL